MTDREDSKGEERIQPDETDSTVADRIGEAGTGEAAATESDPKKPFRAPQLQAAKAVRCFLN